MRNTLKVHHKGWAVPLMCLVLALGGSLLAAALQRTTAERDRSTGQAWQSLQAQALAEGLLARALALLDDPRGVDGSCVPMDTAPVTPAAPATGSRFVDRYLKAGSQMACHVDPEAADAAATWTCTCGTGGVGGIGGSLAANPSRAFGWAELRVEAAPPLMRLISTACVVPPAASSARAAATATGTSTGSGTAPTCTGSSTAGLSVRITLMLRPDGRGNWRVIVGSWTDAV